MQPIAAKTLLISRPRAELYASWRDFTRFADFHELEAVIDRFLPFSSTDTAIIQSSTVARRLPKLK